MMDVISSPWLEHRKFLVNLPQVKMLNEPSLDQPIEGDVNLNLRLAQHHSQILKVQISATAAGPLAFGFTRFRRDWLRCREA